MKILSTLSAFTLLSIISVNSALAFTATDVAACKSAVSTGYHSLCVKRYSFSPVFYDPSCSAGYSQALANCDAGKMTVYRYSKQYSGYTYNTETLIALSTSAYTTKFTFNIVAPTTGQTLPIMLCYRGHPDVNGITSSSYIPLPDDFATLSSNCGGNPISVLIKSGGVNPWWRNEYYSVLGFSKNPGLGKDLVYKCSKNTGSPDPLANPKDHFMSWDAGCEGGNNLGNFGYALH